MQSTLEQHKGLGVPTHRHCSEKIRILLCNTNANVFLLFKMTAKKF